MLWYQITRPFAFLRIKSRELMILRTTVPLIVAAVLVTVYWFLPYKPKISGEKSYVEAVLQIVGNLPGFYIAALAAAATFPNPSLDEEIAGRNPPTLAIRRGGQLFHPVLTLRVFMCHLFAYLCALSFITCVVGIAVQEFTPVLDSVEKDYPNHGVAVWVTLLRYAVVFYFTVCLMRIVTITLHGLFFLIERMHQENR